MESSLVFAKIVIIANGSFYFRGLPGPAWVTVQLLQTVFSENLFSIRAKRFKKGFEIKLKINFF